MPVYVLRNGELVEKTKANGTSKGPYVSSFEAYESPIDGARITSSRQRELDMHRSNAYDVRDIGPNHEFSRAKEARKAENGRAGPKQLDFWR